MTKYSESLRLHSQGVSGRGIAGAVAAHETLSATYWKGPSTMKYVWPFEKELIDEKPGGLSFSREKDEVKQNNPDCEYIHKEPAKSGSHLHQGGSHS